MSKRTENIQVEIDELRNKIADLEQRSSQAVSETNALEQQRQQHVKGTLSNSTKGKASDEFVQLLFKYEQSSARCQELSGQMTIANQELSSALEELQQSKLRDLIESALVLAEQRVSLSDKMREVALQFIEVVAKAQCLDHMLIEAFSSVERAEGQPTRSHLIDHIYHSSSREASAVLAQFVGGEQILRAERIDNGREKPWERERTYREQTVQHLRNKLGDAAAA